MPTRGARDCLNHLFGRADAITLRVTGRPTVVFLSNTHKFIFFSIPRTGTTSILSALRAALPWIDRQEATADDLRTGNFSFDHRESSLLRKHTMPHELRSILGDDLDRYFKFAFVRNPWDWLVSTYFFARSIPLDILIMPDGSPEPFHRLATEARRCPFVDFIRLQNEDPAFGWAFHPFLYAKNGDPLLDFVGRYETIQTDFDSACQRIGLPRLPLDRLNAAHHQHYRDYYDERTRQIVAERFAAMITNFGYEF